MNDLRPQQVADLQRKIKQAKRMARACATAGNNGDKAIIDRRVTAMERELRQLVEGMNK